MAAKKERHCKCTAVNEDGRRARAWHINMSRIARCGPLFSQLETLRAHDSPQLMSTHLSGAGLDVLLGLGESRRVNELADDMAVYSCVGVMNEWGLGKK